MDMGKSVNVQPQQSTAKQKPCADFLGYTVPYRLISAQLSSVAGTNENFDKVLPVS